MYALIPAEGTATYGVPQDDCGIYIGLSNSDRPALVSPQDYERAEDIDWWLNKNGYVFGRPYERTGPISLHRYVLAAAPKTLIDHISGDKLDCRRSNLRFCTTSENRMWSRKRTSTKVEYTSVFKGVSLIKHSGNWAANLCGKRIATFPTEEAAARAYDAAALARFGEFAKVNFPASQ